MRSYSTWPRGPGVRAAAFCLGPMYFPISIDRILVSSLAGVGYNSLASNSQFIGSAMLQPTLDQRVAFLEQEVALLAQLLPGETNTNGKNWRSTLGMFAGDPVMKEIIDEGRAIRERDREQSSE